MTETQQLIASDAAINHWFASCVAVDGTTVVLGAIADSAGGTNAGAVYVFDLSSGQELFKLTASDTAEGDGFGASVAISGNIAVVGSPGDDGQYDSTGSAYIYDVTTGQELHKLTASDQEEYDQFGYSVAISAQFAVVGAQRVDGSGIDSGAVYIFDAITGKELHKVTPSDGAAGDLFGRTVAITGGVVVIGAQHNDHGGLDSGAAYLFDAAAGQEIIKLVSSDAEAGDAFGASVAIYGDRVLIGAPGDDHGGSAAGAAYIFDTNTGLQISKWVASDAMSGDQLGNAVSLYQSFATVGSIFNDEVEPNAGAAYVFNVETGEELAKLIASDARRDDYFGYSVSATDQGALVGVPFYKSWQGAAYVYIVPEFPCLPDTNNNGTLSPADFTAWIAAFNASAPECDQNDDGLCTPADFTAWIANYNAGC